MNEQKDSNPYNLTDEEYVRLWNEIQNYHGHCKVCGETDNLTEVTARPDSTYYLCKQHLAEESE
jgi:hypothetical protein